MMLNYCKGIVFEGSQLFKTFERGTHSPQTPLDDSDPSSHTHNDRMQTRNGGIGTTGILSPCPSAVNLNLVSTDSQGVRETCFGGPQRAKRPLRVGAKLVALEELGIRES